MVFVDTGAFLARYLARDACHRKALAIWGQLSGTPLFTSNHVLDETLTLLARRAGYPFAAERAERLYRSRALEILYSDPETEVEAIGLFRKYGDQQVSFTDCVSFALMQRSGIATAFTFDRHFLRAGFRLVG